MKQTFIISTVSTVVLALATCVTIYLYTSYARPELIYPELLKNDLEKRSNVINLAINSLKNKHAYATNIKMGVENKRNLDEDHEPKAGMVPLENEVEKLFKKVLVENLSSLKTSDTSKKKIEPIVLIDMPPIYALVYPNDLKPNHDQLIYPEDVQVYEFDWMSKADLNLHSGCAKRILNHCRDYLPKEKIEL